MRLYPRRSHFAGLKKHLNDRGIVLPMVLTFVMIYALEAAGLAQYASHAMKQVHEQQEYIRTFYAAEAGLEKGVSQIRLFFEKQGVAPTTAQLHTMQNRVPAVGGSITFNDTSGNNTLALDYSNNWTTKKLTAGDYAGLNGNTRTITVSVSARNTVARNRPKIDLTQTLEVQLIPIFQFGVFYQDDLEILPGANMTFIGPVHTNSDLYAGAQSTSVSLHFNSAISSAGDIHHGRKDSTQAMPGDVFIQDGLGTDQNMKNTNGSWMDSAYSDWLLGSQQRWNGNVTSSAHGVRPLNLPLPTGSQPEIMIDRRSNDDTTQQQAQKMDYKASLRIIDRTIMDAVGNSVELRYCSGGGNFVNNLCPSGQTIINPITTRSFYNVREGKTIQSTDIDMAVLKNSPAFQTITAAAPGGMILYTSDRTNQNSATRQDTLRIVNASSLPTNGITVASENPLYLKGDFNTVNKQPAGLMGDSFNVLSNNWNDANSTQSLANRAASNTTINATVIAGNTDTVQGSYNGGFENLPRFLENWSGRTLTYSGSVINLFQSRIATGPWRGTGSTYNIYNAPNRNWGFDTALSDPNYRIPGFPSVYNIVKSGYEQA